MVVEMETGMADWGWVGKGLGLEDLGLGLELRTNERAARIGYRSGRISARTLVYLQPYGREITIKNVPVVLPQSIPKICGSSSIERDVGILENSCT